MKKELTNYKTKFLYTILKTGEVADIAVDFNIEGEKPALSIISPKTLESEDIKHILTAMEKNLLYRMDYNIKAGCILIIDNEGVLIEDRSIENILK